MRWTPNPLGFEFLCVLQQGVFGQPYAGQNKATEVLAVAINDIEGCLLYTSVVLPMPGLRLLVGSCAR